MITFSFVFPEAILLYKWNYYAHVQQRMVAHWGCSLVLDKMLTLNMYLASFNLSFFSSYFKEYIFLPSDIFYLDTVLLAGSIFHRVTHRWMKNLSI